MEFINWDESLSVGLNYFDEQHKKLIRIINKLYDSMKERKSREILSEIFNELIDYTKTHFKSEEEMMIKYNYPHYIAHYNEHKKLTEEVLKLQEKYNKGELFISVEVMNFLKDWLSHHILETDKKYGPFLKEKGIK
ncbi:MAG: bacteriohemerythrin [Brevinematia bacterium]